MLKRLWRKLPEGVRDPLWWLRYRFDPKHQYHLVRTGLEPGYYEGPDRLLNATMQLLCEWVEEAEGGPEKLATDLADMEQNHQEWCWVRELDSTKWTAEEAEAVVANQKQIQEHVDCERELLAIYLWWKRCRPEQLEEHDGKLMLLYGGDFCDLKDWDNVHPVAGISRKQYHEEELALNANDQAMLERVVALRGWL